MAYIKDRNEPIYTISVAARLVRPTGIRAVGAEAAAKPIHAQTLRMYDRLGLVKPQKVGKNRFYSEKDIERLQRIQHFTQDIGINLAGVAFIFAMMDKLGEMETPNEHIEALLVGAEAQLREWVDESED
jgi:MerR family transcriptional regulator/heat shock protein HspR